MVVLKFQVYPAKRIVYFKCKNCGKKRQRSFSVECTVNPFNVDNYGRQLSPDEVRQQSAEKLKVLVSEFRSDPWCSSCEKSISYGERRELRKRRQQQDN